MLYSAWIHLKPLLLAIKIKKDLVKPLVLSTAGTGATSGLCAGFKWILSVSVNLKGSAILRDTFIMTEGHLAVATVPAITERSNHFIYKRPLV